MTLSYMTPMKHLLLKSEMGFVNIGTGHKTCVFHIKLCLLCTTMKKSGPGSICAMLDDELLPWSYFGLERICPCHW